MADRLLLDTCAMIWLSQGEPVADAAMAAIDAVEAAGEPISLSVMSAWELGLLVATGRIASTKPPLRWFQDFVAAADVTVEAVTADILIASSCLPAPVHGDPMDRILIATAREHDLTIVTRDRAILAYGEAGHVRTLAC
ncbi:type II toxin-antitoxin system VapC family toxin [Polymorphum gilvum]|uniref:Ribonuclease VapC n=1 Tax=Polymorphum gilvum (strain LMG 25793 / CGMCC 1.9160 / SL003B-26A1) TaxID=991905 RepID=F2J136_POLGS|nr:PIN domain-containing protein [Polymorphum gilvum]ADZ71982.1 PilT protein-like protein [Polymorphum gilvum SL003B-26A1]